MLRTADACRAGRRIFLRRSDCRLLRHSAGHAASGCGSPRRAGGFINVIDRADNFSSNCAEHAVDGGCKAERGRSSPATGAFCCTTGNRQRQRWQIRCASSEGTHSRS